MEQNTEYSIFEDIDQQAYFEYATTGQRFGNYLVDIVAYYIFVFIFTAISAFIMSAAGMSGDDIGAFFDDKLKLYSLLIPLHIIFYTLMEGLGKGKTLGKLITGTRAVQDDCRTPITFKQAFFRSLCRIIPFDVLSGISGRPWHDSMTKTTVIKK